ncbi:hypothetical protein PLESTM_000444000 [Pleodorina starrii]|nr:hypothetical protein PLESTM_000444000 [Pleodorina starrii]
MGPSYSPLGWSLPLGSPPGYASVAIPSLPPAVFPSPVAPSAPFGSPLAGVTSAVAPMLGVAGGRLARVVAQLPPSLPVPAPEQDRIYQEGLATAERMLLGALAPSTVRRQDGAAREFLSWLDRCGRGRSWANCTPDDILVFMVAHWLPNHCSRGGGPAGPAAVKSCLSALSGFFGRAGRGGRYDAATGLGNPCDSVWVEDFRTAYQRTRVSAGYTELSAVPLRYDKYRSLVLYLWRQVEAAPNSLERVVLLRDLLCVLLLWQTSVRGHDVGKLGLGDFVDPARPDLPYDGFPLPPPWSWGAAVGPTLCFRERGTKTYKLARAPPVWLLPNAIEPAFCVPRTLAFYQWCCGRPDSPPGGAITDLLFRPLTEDQRGFKPSALQSATLAARIRKHLVDAGLYENETVHSFRRGALQAAAAAGGSTSALLDFAQLRSTVTLARYLDRSRHEPDERNVRPRL